MLINKDTAILTCILLVPYDTHHVKTYHTWMQDPDIQAATASEPLSLDEEHGMQQSWRTDGDKLTFIVCLPVSSATTTTLTSADSSSPDAAEASKGIKAGVYDAPNYMLGDINLFLTPADEDDEGCNGELELMIAPNAHRRRGYGRAAVLTFMSYLQRHLDEILNEYSKSRTNVDVRGRTKLVQLRVKIGSKNEMSIGLFQSLGFVRVGEGENYFGEVELVFEELFGEWGMEELLDKFGISVYKEVLYWRVE